MSQNKKEISLGKGYKMVFEIKKQIANIITSSRILCAACLLFCPVFSLNFYILYLFCGVTDMVDGTVARKTKADSEIGAKLDTVADAVFVSICFIKITPLIHLPTLLWIWIAVIAIIKIGYIIWGYILKKQLISLHTITNKITGLLLFLFPLTLNLIEPIYSAVVICLFAMLATIKDGYFIKRNILTKK